MISFQNSKVLFRGIKLIGWQKMRFKKGKNQKNIIRSQRDDDKRKKEDLEFEDFEVVYFESLFQKAKLELLSDLV